MWLLLADIWAQGDGPGVEKITEGKSYFHPLFISKDIELYDVLYDMEEMKQDPALLINYFTEDPQKLEDVLENCQEKLLKAVELAKKNNPDDFDEIIDLYVEAWPGIGTSIVVGEATKESHPKVHETAMKFRRATERVEDGPLYKLCDYAEILRFDLGKCVAVATIDELRDKTTKQSDLKDRLNGLYFFENQVGPLKNLESFSKKQGISLEQVSADRTKVIKGSPASPGKIRGKARVIMLEKDFPSFQEGEILVSYMTKPVFLPLMKMASGFITDEGGVMCHAAIVAREMKKPCVIGTKHATQIIQTGDEIELNADTGTIRILA